MDLNRNFENPSAFPHVTTVSPEGKLRVLPYRPFDGKGCWRDQRPHRPYGVGCRFSDGVLRYIGDIFYGELPETLDRESNGTGYCSSHPVTTRPG